MDIFLFINCDCLQITYNSIYLKLMTTLIFQRTNWSTIDQCWFYRYSLCAQQIANVLCQYFKTSRTPPTNHPPLLTERYPPNVPNVPAGLDALTTTMDTTCGHVPGLAFNSELFAQLPECGRAGHWSNAQSFRKRFSATRVNVQNGTRTVRGQWFPFARTDERTLTYASQVCLFASDIFAYAISRIERKRKRYTTSAIGENRERRQTPENGWSCFRLVAKHTGSLRCGLHGWSA